jgi:hypothetical protein
MVTNQTLTEAEEEPLMEALLKTARNIIAPNLEGVERNLSAE